jgi:L-seryl-tRNA(Ser) seleniumtransferase
VYERRWRRPVRSPIVSATERPPSVDRLAREMAAATDLPHPVCVELARAAIDAGGAGSSSQAALAAAAAYRRTLLRPVINATGVLLHTNLGRAPSGIAHPAAAINVELDLASGERGSRQAAVGRLLATLCGAEAALVVNNNAAAVLLALAALARDREVLVSRGESVEIGGGFRVPEVMEQSGARLVDVGTTNRTRLSDYSRALARKNSDVALVLKVHPSNYRVDGFVESTAVKDLATLVGPRGEVPVVADIGSGLVDAACPWLPGPPPAWLADEPAARQTLADGAALVTFSGDKLFAGPQAGIIAGRADLVAACARHPLARALRPGTHVLLALQSVALAYLHKRAHDELPFWRMATVSVNELSVRATQLVADSGCGTVVATEAVPGAGSAPGAVIPSVGVVVPGDHLTTLRAAPTPIVARSHGGDTLLDLRSVDPDDDVHLAAALVALTR